MGLTQTLGSKGQTSWKSYKNISIHKSAIIIKTRSKNTIMIPHTFTTQEEEKDFLMHVHKWIENAANSSTHLNIC